MKSKPDADEPAPRKSLCQKLFGRFMSPDTDEEKQKEKQSRVPLLTRFQEIFRGVLDLLPCARRDKPQLSADKIQIAKTIKRLKKKIKKLAKAQKIRPTDDGAIELESMRLELQFEKRELKKADFTVQDDQIAKVVKKTSEEAVALNEHLNKVKESGDHDPEEQVDTAAALSKKMAICDTVHSLLMNPAEPSPLATIDLKPVLPLVSLVFKPTHDAEVHMEWEKKTQAKHSNPTMAESLARMEDKKVQTCVRNNMVEVSQLSLDRIGQEMFEPEYLSLYQKLPQFAKSGKLTASQIKANLQIVKAAMNGDIDEAKIQEMYEDDLEWVTDDCGRVMNVDRSTNSDLYMAKNGKGVYKMVMLFPSHTEQLLGVDNDRIILEILRVFQQDNMYRGLEGIAYFETPGYYHNAALVLETFFV